MEGDQEDHPESGLTPSAVTESYLSGLCHRESRVTVEHCSLTQAPLGRLFLFLLAGGIGLNSLGVTIRQAQYGSLSHLPEHFLALASVTADLSSCWPHHLAKGHAVSFTLW